MDDFNINVLNESKNEWCGRLLNIFTPLILEGIQSIFQESYKLCKSNNELDKYLMTFQNFITRIPKWSQTILEEEKLRIIEKSGCPYLEDLITCVHIIQLKALTAIRVGQKQKKIDIDIPKLDVFIHKIYIHIARKIYTNVYLFETNIPPLKIQKNNRQIELLIQESIMNTIRDSIPVDTILKVYMDETVEEDVIEEIKEKEIKNKEEIQELKKKTEEIPSQIESKIAPGFIEDIPPLQDDDDFNSCIKFNDLDMVRDENNNDGNVLAPKTIERLDEISQIRNEQRKKEEEEDDEDEPIKLKIFNDSAIDSSTLKMDFLEPEILSNDLLLGDIEEL
jgi:hypothetical protein